MAAAGSAPPDHVRRTGGRGEEERGARAEFQGSMPATLPPSPPRTPRAPLPEGAGTEGAGAEPAGTGAAGTEPRGTGAAELRGTGAAELRETPAVELVVGRVVPPAMVTSAEPVSPLQVKETEYTAPRRASRSTVTRAVCPRAMLTVSKIPEEAVA
ncbi:hypothetical protein ACFQGN_04115 [Streptomyces goshikiensis]|uniref:hypothetical protein n=1 Tax=Streptomyces goshikiensis TaxID=1942 RepID=UPI003614E679